MLPLSSRLDCSWTSILISDPSFSSLMLPNLLPARAFSRAASDVGLAPDSTLSASRGGKGTHCDVETATALDGLSGDVKKDVEDNS